MKVEPCSCGGDSSCPVCDGCGEVAILSALEIRRMRRKFQHGELEALTGQLNQEQADRFTKIILEATGLELDGEITKEESEAADNGSESNL